HKESYHTKDQDNISSFLLRLLFIVGEQEGTECLCEPGGYEAIGDYTIQEDAFDEKVLESRKMGIYRSIPAVEEFQLAMINTPKVPQVGCTLPLSK
ncbi:hypothetical protein BGX31_000787, partial [Mortierella sp. GBA43]